MKKTMTINLSGLVFNIDEDAYSKLQQYLADLGRHFSEEEKEEIMGDIEARIAELFTSRLVNRNVVEMKDVEEVIAVMGQPSQFEDGNETKKEERTTTPNASEPKRKQVRKLYRDSTNKMIGGVASGLAAYMDWDVTPVRLLFVLVLLLSFGWTSFIYILMWIFVPEARTVAQHLEMQGVEPNVDNIKNYSANNEPLVTETSSGISKVFKIIIIVLFGLVGFSLLATVLGLFIAMILLMFNLVPGILVGVNEILLILSVSIFLLCPAIAIVMFCFYLADTRRPRRRGMVWVLLALWLLSVVGIAVTGAKAYNHRNELQSGVLADRQQVVFVREPRAQGQFTAIKAEDGIEVRFEQHDSVSIEVKAPDDIINKVKTEIRNDTLYISYDEARWSGRDRIIVWVSAPELNKIDVSDGCNFLCESPLKAQKLEILLEESSSVDVAGRVDTLLVKAEESARADLAAMDVDVAVVHATESSHVFLGNIRNLQIVSSETSNVSYRGEPEILRKSSSKLSFYPSED
ncbi:MAG: DUF2807 domain-containing protein [Bacteroidales bacterium]|nr:DUF2807 domain-containing protein [Bacteroidales bacterium]